MKSHSSKVKPKTTIKDEFDAIRTITELRNIIIRANKRLQTVEWDLYFHKVPNPKNGRTIEVYRLIKNVQLKDSNNRPYWWPTIIVGDIPRHRLLKWFRTWCRTNKRDTLSKAAANHSDYKRAANKPKIKKSMAASDMAQQPLQF